jgi:hypothetical protein
MADVGHEHRLHPRGLERLVAGQRELLLGGLAVGDVVQERVEGETLLHLDRRDRQLDRELVAVAVQRRQLQPPPQHRPLAGGEEALEAEAVGRSQTVGDDRLGQLATERLAARPAEARFGLGVPAGDPAARVDRDEGVVGVLDDLAGPVVAALEGRLDHLALGDVARRGVDELLLDDGHRAPLDPTPAAVLGREAVDEVDGDAAHAQAGGLLLGPRAVVVVDELHEGPRAQLVLGPAERLRPRRVELLEVAVEPRRADQVTRELEVARAALELRLDVASQTPVLASPS